jgi:hypothetical protein
MRSRTLGIVVGAGLGAWFLGATAVMTAARRGSLAPTALGKRADGSFSPSRLVALLPVLGPKWARWHLRRWREGHERAYVELSPGLFIGRRPLAGELPPAARTVIDLAANYREVADVRERVAYRSVPMLQAHGLSPAEAARLARDIARRRAPVYLHCANGEKRTAAIAALALIAEGRARTPTAALGQVKGARPSSKPTDEQIALVRAAARWLPADRQRRGSGGVSSRGRNAASAPSSGSQAQKR